MVKVQAPGRINIIGEHTDYNDGFVLPAAIDKYAFMHVEKNGTAAQVYVEAKNVKETWSFNLNSFSPLESGWQNYIMGVVHELQKEGACLSGFNAFFDGNVPIGAGISSSAALECSLALALNELFELGFSKEKLAKAAQMAEHNFVGIRCGIMDQFASMMGKQNHVMLLDCRSLDFEYIPCELGDYELLLLNSNVSHTLATSEYNNRRAACEAGVEILRKVFPIIKNLRDISIATLNKMKPEFPNPIYRRCLHVVKENERVLEAKAALIQKDIDNLGALLYASHKSLQFDYEVSCQEVDYLVDWTKDKAYVLGSRMMGGGFGGCTINLVKKGMADQLIESVAKCYQKVFGIELSPYKVKVGNGAELIS